MNMSFIVFTFAVVGLVFMFYEVDLSVLTALPLIVLSVGLVWSMKRIQEVVKILNSDEFYSNEKIVNLHITMFVVFTVVITIEYTLDFIGELRWSVSKEELNHTDEYYKWQFAVKVLDCTKSVVVNIIGYVMLYMLLKYSQEHHKDDFKEATEKRNAKFLLVFNNDAKGLDAVNQSHQLELMRKEAERRQERNEDAA